MHACMYVCIEERKEGKGASSLFARHARLSLCFRDGRQMLHDDGKREELPVSVSALSHDWLIRMSAAFFEKLSYVDL